MNHPNPYDIPPPTDHDAPPEPDTMLTQTDAFLGLDNPPSVCVAAVTQTDAFSGLDNPPALCVAAVTQTDAFSGLDNSPDLCTVPPPTDYDAPDPVDITGYWASSMPENCLRYNPKTGEYTVEDWAFATWFSHYADVRYINNQFYLCGEKISNKLLKRTLVDIVRVRASITPQRLSNIVALLECFTTMPPPDVSAESIYFTNRTLTLYRQAIAPAIRLRAHPAQQFVQCRIPHAFDAAAGSPTLFLHFMAGLFSPQDLRTVQEYLGYCLLPSTKAQKALFIIGKGGEGKSRLTVLMKLVLGDAAIVSSVAKIGEQFFGTMLENRLLFIDDDLQTAKFNATDTFKTLVTNETDLVVEPKGNLYYEIRPYTRFLLMGNQSVGSLHDKSHGFYRRIHIINTLPAPKNRVNNPNLIQDIWAAEQAGILLWLVQGALRLARQNYRLTESEESKRALAALKEDDNTALSFLQEQSFVYGAGCSVTSSELTAKYRDWCYDNDLFKVSGQAFKQTCETFFAKGGGMYNANIYHKEKCKHVRGYKGVEFVY